MSKKLTTEEWIKKAKSYHGDKYDYSESVYVDRHTKIKIKCNVCGNIFYQDPSEHAGHRFAGCPECAKKKCFTTEEFIERARKIHGDKYDYSKTNYLNNKTKVCIICPEHGEFWQTPGNHTNGSGCPKCKAEKIGNLKRKTKEQFILDAKRVHGDKYDYSKVEYKNNSTKVCIICPEHGEFWQAPDKHLQGEECPICSLGSKSKGEQKIIDFLEINNIRYLYNKCSIEELGKLRPDFYLPDYNLVIEYDGKQHFSQTTGGWGKRKLKEIQLKDGEKNKLCEENSIGILRIPYTEFNNIDEILRRKLLND